MEDGDQLDSETRLYDREPKWIGMLGIRMLMGKSVHPTRQYLIKEALADRSYIMEPSPGKVGFVIEVFGETSLEAASDLAGVRTTLAQSLKLPAEAIYEEVVITYADSQELGWLAQQRLI